jgi:hypothetical protein
LVCVAERYNRYGTRILLEVEDRLCSIPREWTDLVAPDPEVILGEGRALVRVRDLMALAGLVGRLVGERSPEGSDEV